MPRSPVSARRTRPGLVLVALMTMLLALSCTPGRDRGDRAPALAELQRAARRSRAFEVRLTGFPWAPPASPGPAGAGDVDLLLAARRVLATDESQARATPRLRAAAHLFLRDPDSSIRVLEQALAESPLDAALMTDLAAAYLVRARELDKPDDVARALNVAEGALTISPRAMEAQFNRALALEALPLPSQAAEAWRAYRAADPGSKWSDEAGQHLSRVEAVRSGGVAHAQQAAVDALGKGIPSEIEAVAGRHPQWVREAFEEHLLRGWAVAATSGDAVGAAKAVASARITVTALERRGDKLPRAVLSAVERATEGQRRELARGHLDYATGRAHQRLGEAVPGRAAFLSARRAFHRAGSPMRGWADVQLAILDYNGQRVADAETRLRGVAREAHAGAYLSLSSRAAWMIGLIQVGRARFDEALAQYHEALASYERLGEIENAGAVHNLKSEVLRDLGRWRDSWIHHRAALSVTEISPSRRQTILLTAAISASGQELWATALRFQNESLSSAIDSGLANLVVDSYVRRAVARARLTDEAGALDDLGKAEEWRARLTDRGLQARLAAEIASQRGELERRSDPVAAVGAVTAAIEFFTAEQRARRLPALYLSRALAHLAARNPAAAEADLLHGIATFEASRLGLGNESLRVSYFDEAWRLFETLIALQIDHRHNPDAALATAERGRSRTLVDRLRFRRPVDPATLQVPDKTALLYFAVLDDRVLGWVITARARRHFQSTIRRAELRRLVDGARREMLDPRATRASAVFSRQLHAALVAPALDATGRDTALFIVADGALHEVSFPALIDNKTAEYLVEQRAVAMTPSATVFLHPLAGAPSGRLPRALVMGNPSFDASRVKLPALPDAEREALEVAAQYGATAYVGRLATAARFLHDAGQHEVVHFAGHAVANPLYPDLSEFLLAPDGARAGALTSSDVSGMHFPATKLVVLAACSTAAGAPSRGEGALSLARPFLTAGVPAVVATLWDVEDAPARRLALRLHASWRATHAPLDALRDAQLELLRAGEAVRNWAGFTLIARAGPDRKSPDPNP